MKKKLIYTSFAMTLALLSLASCGKKNNGGGGGGKPSDDEDMTSPYSIDYNQEYHSIAFYDGDYARDDSGKLVKDENGLYTLVPGKKNLLSVQINVGTELSWLPTPKKEGYTFEGWFVDEGLSTPFYYTEMPQGDLVAYARWSIDQDTIYVAPNGSPDNDGTKKSKAMSLLEASRVYKAGAKIILTDGTYTEKRTVVFGNQGDANHVTVVEASSPDKVILDFSKQAEADSNQGIKLSGNYHQFYNFTVKGAGDNGFLLGSSNNIIENCVFTENHDTGLQISRYSGSTQPFINTWPSNNLVLNCTSYNNSDSAGEDADGFAAKLTVGYNNVFDGCMAYWNVDDGWDLYAKQDSGRIGLIRIQNCVSFQNGHKLNDSKNDVYADFSGDGNGFKLGGTSVPGEVIVDNCVAAWNYAHGFTDNSNPGTIAITNSTAINNGQYGSTSNAKEYDNINLNRDAIAKNRNYYSGVLSYYSSSDKNVNIKYKDDEFNGSVNNSIFYQGKTAYVADGALSVQYGSGFTSSKNVSAWSDPTNGSAVDDTYPIDLIAQNNNSANFHDFFRNDDGSINLNGVWGVNSLVTNQIQTGANLNASSDTYNHYKFTQPDASKKESDDETTARELLNAIDLALVSGYIYSDIYLPCSINGTSISWSSSKTDTISISNTTAVENGVDYCYGVLADRIDTDTKVTLTATITVGSKNYTKSFEVTCQGLEPRIGTISGIDNVTQLTTDAAVNLDSYIVKDYTSTRLTLTAGSDYTVSKTIQYVDDYMTEAQALVATGYTTVNTVSAAGTYLITYTFHIDGYNDIVKYRVITLVDNNDTLEVNEAKVYLNTIIDNVASITGDVNYTSGTVYAVAVATGATAPSAADIKAGTSESTTIVSELGTYTLTSRSFAIDLPITVDETAVDVYIVVENSVGLGQVYKISNVEPTEEISTYEELVSALNEGTGAYKLTADIDCAGATLTQTSSSTKFKGYFDGAGHTISNLNISVTGEGGGLFYKTTGGAIIKNLQLFEIHVNQTDIADGSGGKTGILIGCVETGDTTVSNISIVDSSVNAFQRVGGLIGEVKGLNNTDTIPTVKISNISITSTHSNDPANYSIRSGYETKDATGTTVYTGGKYVGGILAHVQYGANVLIDKCYVNEALYCYNQYAGGILGRVDPQTDSCDISVTNCVFGGLLNGLGEAASYTAGIVGGRSSGVITVTNNAVTGTATGKNSGNVVSTNLTVKKAIGTTNVYTINEYTTFADNYYRCADYNDEMEYSSASDYIAALKLNNEWRGEPIQYSEMNTEIWWTTNMAGFMSAFNFQLNGTNLSFTLKF